MGYAEFNYSPSAWNFHFNGNYLYGKSSDLQEIKFEGQVYYLEDIRFHTPSEHRLNGEPHDAEIQFIHKNSRGEYLAVAVMVWEGSRLPAFDAVKERLPRKAGMSKYLVGFDLRKLLPKKNRYYRYAGSLTSPPCSEGVTWLVLQQGIQLSGHQIDQLSLAQGKNNRPLQKIGSRVPLRNR